MARAHVGEEVKLEELNRNQYLGIMAAVFVGATLGGIVYHSLTCKTCKESKGEKAISQVAKASADMNGTTAPRVVP